MSVQTYSSALDPILTQLVRYLNVSQIRRHLKQAGQLTDDEYEQLEVSANNTTETAIDKLIKILKRKGPGHEEKLLSALKESMDPEVADPHSGHGHIIPLLEEQIASFGSRCLGTSPVHYHGHRQLTATDSGISRDGPYMRNSSGSPSSSVSGSSISSSYMEGSASRLDSKAPLELARFELIEGRRKDRQEIDDLRHKVLRDSEQITMKFARLGLEVYRLLARNEVDLEEVQLTLRFLGCSQSQRTRGELRTFSDTSDISLATSLNSLVQSLGTYSSWFNYSLLKFVAETFGGEEGERLILDYEDELRRYYETVIIYQCPQFSLTNGIPPGYEQLQVKVNWDYRKCTVQDVALFQASLSDILDLKPHVFQLKMVEEGCVMCTWAVPESVGPHIINEVYLHTSELAQVQVIDVRILGRCIVISHGRPTKKPSPEIRLDPKELKPLTVTTSTTSTTSSFSFMSNLTCSSSKRNSHTDCDSAARRASQLSQLGFDVPETAAEIDILSIYSGISGHTSCSTSPKSKPSGQRLSDEYAYPVIDSGRSPLECSNTFHMEEKPHPPMEKPHPLPVGYPPRSYHSESNLHELTRVHPLIPLSKREVRAMSTDMLRIQPQDDHVERPCTTSPTLKNQLPRITGCSCGKTASFLRSWFPRGLLRPFRRQHNSNNATPAKRDKPPSDTSDSFPILPLSMEPQSQSGLYYYCTDPKENREQKDLGTTNRDLASQDRKEHMDCNKSDREPSKALQLVPELVVESAHSPAHTVVGSYTSSRTLSIVELTAAMGTNHYSRQDSETQNSLQPPQKLTVHSSEGSGYAISPISSSGYGGSVSTSPRFPRQFSEENEIDLFDGVPPRVYPRARAYSAPHKLHSGIRRKPSIPRTHDDPIQVKPQRYPSATAYDYRVNSPESSIYSRRTSGYSSQSDLASAIPTSPFSQPDSHFTSLESLAETPLVQQKQFPVYLPERRHSMNSHSLYAAQRSPPAITNSAHCNRFNFETRKN